MKKEEPVDTAGIVLDLLQEILKRLEGLNGDYGKPSKPPRNGGGNVTALVVVTLLLGIVIGALIALLLSGCEAVEPVAALIGLGSLYQCKPAQIKLVRQSFFSLIVDKNDTVQPMEESAARRVLLELGYVLISESKEHGTDVETWELPSHRQTPC